MRKYFAIILMIAVLFCGCDSIREAREAAAREKLAAEARTAWKARLDKFVYIDIETELTFPVTIQADKLESAVALLKTAAPTEGVDTDTHTSEALFWAGTPDSEELCVISSPPQSSELYAWFQPEEVYSIDRAAFYALLENYITQADYYYADRPIAYISAGGAEPLEMQAAEADYAYYLVDGSRNQHSHTSDLPVRLQMKEGERLSFSLLHLDENGRCCQSGLSAKITLDGEDVWQGLPEELEAFVPVQSGVYIIEISGTHSEEGRSEGEFTWRAEAEWQLPITVEVETPSSNPGEAVVIRVRNIPKGGQVTFTSPDIEFKPVFFADSESSAVTVIPFRTRAATGEYSYTIKCGDFTEQGKITVLPRDFVVQNLTVTEEVTSSTIESEAANAEYRNAIVPIRPIRDETAHWSEDFIWPIHNPSKRSTEFGTIRYVNKNPTPTWHNAIDFNLPLGTDVLATNRGRVLFAGFLQLSGNTVVIEHGYGVKSWYYHMNSLTDIKTGDMVELGEKIGEIGSTGFSTGPHLHFEFTITDFAVNPDTIIEDKLLNR